MDLCTWLGSFLEGKKLETAVRRCDDAMVESVAGLPLHSPEPRSVICVIRSETSSLEDVFLDLTGKSINE